MRRQVLPAGIGEKVAVNLVAAVRGGGTVHPDTRIEELFRGKAVIERHDETALDPRADVTVGAPPLRSHVGKLSDAKLHAAGRKILDEMVLGGLFAPIETAAGERHSKLVEPVVAPHDPRRRNRVEKLVRENEMDAVPR